MGLLVCEIVYSRRGWYEQKLKDPRIFDVGVVQVLKNGHQELLDEFVGMLERAR